MSSPKKMFNEREHSTCTEHFKETQIFSMVRKSMSIRRQAVENLSASGKPFKFH